MVGGLPVRAIASSGEVLFLVLNGTGDGGAHGCRNLSWKRCRGGVLLLLPMALVSRETSDLLDRAMEVSSRLSPPRGLSVWFIEAAVLGC